MAAEVVTAALARSLGVPESKIAITDAHVGRLQPLIPIFREVAHQLQLPSWYLLAGIARQESDYVPTARNASSGAAGLMQVMPFHFARLGWGANTWREPRPNVEAGGGILRDMLRAHGSIPRALAGYGGFSTWLRTGKAELDGVYQRRLDATWYINQVLGSALIVEYLDRLGKL
jgi:soluble lytic murein transglycosylase-like protein